MQIQDPDHIIIHNHPSVIQSSWGAFTAQKCPHCHAGAVFKYPAYNLKFTQMHKNCPVCGQLYEIETGFFWGSMYISYFMTVIIGFFVGFTNYMVVKDPPVMQVLGWICLALAVLSPLSFRYSRLIMLYSFASIKFDPKAGKK